MYNVYLSLPDLTPEESRHVKVPRDLDDAKNLARVISVYEETVSEFELSIENWVFSIISYCS